MTTLPKILVYKAQKYFYFTPSILKILVNIIYANILLNIHIRIPDKIQRSISYNESLENVAIFTIIKQRQSECIPLYGGNYFNHIMYCNVNIVVQQNIIIQERSQKTSSYNIAVHLKDSNVTYLPCYIYLKLNIIYKRKKMMEEFLMLNDYTN